MVIKDLQELDQILAGLDDDVLDQFAVRLREECEHCKTAKLQRLDLFITQRCNLRCDYCFLDGSDRQGDMPIEVAQESLELAMRMSQESELLDLTLFGGEPLLRMDLMGDILSIASRMCSENGKHLGVSCTTNGLLIDDRAMEIAEQYRFRYLLSIDGSADIHDKHRKTVSGKGTFDLLAKKIPYLKARQKWLGARMTVTPEHIGSLASGVRELADMGINQFIVGLVSELPWTAEQLAQIKGQMFELLNFYLSARESGRPIRMTTIDSELHSDRYSGIWGCSAGIRGIAIDAQGDIYPCARFIRRDEYRMGNVLKGPVNWDIGNTLNDRRIEVRWKCLNCDYTAYCSGGCPEANIVASRTPFYPNDAHCEQVKAVADLLVEYPEFQRLFKPKDANPDGSSNSGQG